MADPTAPDNHPVPDVIQLAVPAGGQVLVVGDLHLERRPAPVRSAALGALARALQTVSGPGLLVLAGNTFAGGDPSGPVSPASVLGDHPRLVSAITGWTATTPGRRVVALPGERDAHLGWSPGARAELESALCATVALAVEIDFETGSGRQRVRVESGRDLDELSRVTDPTDPAETPFGHHLRRELIPALLTTHRDRSAASRAEPAESGTRSSLPARLVQAGLGRDWLDGIDLLDDQAAFPRFVASRLVYRLLGRRSWLLLVPLAVAIVLRLPVRLADAARAHAVGPGRAGFVLLAFAVVVEVALLAAVAVGALRRTWQALAGVSLGAGSREPNRAARDRARSLVAAGYRGLVTGHTCRAEVTDLVCGFYANPGCVADVVTEARPRIPGLGLPPAFVAHRQVSWLELESGGELHVRLMVASRPLPGATLAERSATRRLPAIGGQDLRPELVGSYPHGDSWPVEPSGQLRRRRVRRWSSLFVAVAAFVSLVSAFSAPLRDRLGLIRRIVPIVVPETAAALTAIAGVALLMLARGVRRGQTRAWAATLAILVLSAVTNVVKGVDVEEAAVALAVATYLWVNRAEFRAAADRPRLRRDLLGWLGAAALTVVAGTAGVELGVGVRTLVLRRLRHLSAVHRLHTRLPPRFSIGWGRAFEATTERMVGVGDVSLPQVISRFVDPTMAAAACGLALLLLAILFRPVVTRRRRPGAGEAAPEPLERARAIVARHGHGTLDYFALRSDKELFFWGDTVVAYGVYGGVCLVSPDPVGPLPEREPAWRAFRRFADERGWTVGCLGAGEEWLPFYRATGMRTLYVGDEGVVRTDRFTLEGGRFKGLRQAVNRVAKYGYTISFHDPAELDPDLRSSLREVMARSRRGGV
ncbi:MAG: phosphatidylglycerol lysyltransferase domain-containing protein, partial [Actinomycetota bacterium]|nr:phosphatidylglycerol lysyltransferase domain-containing protein [Actinomycetota bacterium]